MVNLLDNQTNSKKAKKHKAIKANHNPIHSDTPKNLPHKLNINNHLLIINSHLGNHNKNHQQDIQQYRENKDYLVIQRIII
jgi:hypothetical protein